MICPSTFVLRRLPLALQHSLCALLLLGAYLFAPTTLRADQPPRPNFLFVYADDHRYDALSVVQREQGERGRFPWFQTPNLDRLAAEGIRFRNAFVVSSLCAPSRAVFLTGRYNHLNGVASNFRPFPVDNVTHATVLRGAGYTTGYIGKWHMDNQRERPGFDYHSSYLGHARYVDPTFVVQGKDVPRQGWIDDLATDDAIEFLRRAKAGAKPWSLVVGLKSPHGPFEPPERARERFAGERARRVPNLESQAAYLPADANGARRRKAADPAATDVDVNLNYFRCISAIDDCVGRLLDALDDLDLAQNTVVVYTSDNGFYLGEHGLGDKRSAYDESLRIPFLVRWPAIGNAARGQTVDAMVLNLDLAPTLLDLANVPIPATMQGRSWRPFLTNPAAPGRDAWFYEYFAEKQRNSRVPDITAVRTTNAKLIKYPGHDDWTELFDLARDPYETRNLSTDPAHAALRERLESEHQRLAAEVAYRVPDFVDRPDWWGRPGGPDADRLTSPELRLDLDFGRATAARVPDAGPHGNHGRPRQLGATREEQGRRAAEFTGASVIDIAKTPSLNPADLPWTVEATVNPAQPTGVIVARGGASQGFSLWLDDGRAAWTVVIDGKAHSVWSERPIKGWTTIRGVLSRDKQINLLVDGQRVGSREVGDLLPRDPSDGLQVGADLGSRLPEVTERHFQGWIERVRMWAGEP